MKLMPASSIAEITQSNRPNFISFEKMVETFLDTKLREAIVEVANRGLNSVNIQVPFEAYENLTKFYEIANKKLTDLGYTSKESHDGGGMYSTLFVTWKI